MLFISVSYILLNELITLQNKIGGILLSISNNFSLLKIAIEMDACVDLSWRFKIVLFF